MGFIQTQRYIGLSINVQAANSYIRERKYKMKEEEYKVLPEYLLNFDSEQFWEIYTIFI